MLNFLGPLISGASSLIGGIMGQNTQENVAAQNIALQREFAQNGIKWKVEDAQRAGIHPLYALGASTASFSPISVGNSLGAGVASFGQDISRALNATRSTPERDDAFQKTVQDLTLTNAALKNELLGAQIAKLRQSGPPMPDIPIADQPPAKMPRLYIDGGRYKTDPLTSGMKDVEDRYGDEGPMNWLMQAIVAWNDLQANYGKPATWPSQMVDRAWEYVKGDASREYQNLQRMLGRR